MINDTREWMQKNQCNTTAAGSSLRSYKCKERDKGIRFSDKTQEKTGMD